MNTKLIYTCSNCGKKFEFDEKYTKDIVLKHSLLNIHVSAKIV